MNKLYTRALVTLLAIAAGYSNLNAYKYSATKPFYVAVDYLFWQALEDQLIFAGNRPIQFPDPQYPLGVIDQKFKGSSGVRTKAGYFWGEGTDVSFAWTRLRTCSFSNFQSDPDSVFASALNALLDTDSASGASSTWCLKFNTFDLELGQRWCSVQSITLHPHVGLKGALIKQFQDLNYFGISGASQAEVQRKNNFWAIGPQCGLDMQWDIVKRIAMIGGISGALVYGKFDIASQFLIVDGQTLNPNFTNHKKRLRPMTQCMLGLQWQRDMGKVLIELSAAYEVQYWWNQWQNIPSVGALINSVLSNGDLMLHGLTLGAGIRF